MLIWFLKVSSHCNFALFQFTLFSTSSPHQLLQVLPTVYQFTQRRFPLTSIRKYVLLLCRWRGPFYIAWGEIFEVGANLLSGKLQIPFVHISIPASSVEIFACPQMWPAVSFIPTTFTCTTYTVNAFRPSSWILFVVLETCLKTAVTSPSVIAQYLTIKPRKSRDTEFQKTFIALLLMLWP